MGTGGIRPAASHRLRVPAFGLVALALCGACRDEPPEEGADPVLTALLAHWRSGQDGKPERVILLRRETRPGPLADPESGQALRERMLGKLDGLLAETVDDFARANAASTDLAALLRPSPALRLVGNAEHEALFGTTRNSREYDAACRTLFTRYPGSRWLRTVSLPGTSRDGSQALVYVAEEMYSRVADGEYCLLIRSGDGWRVAGRFTVWIS